MAINPNSIASNRQRIRSQLEHWKKQLIDFSKRNQLLFFKARPTLTIELKEAAKEIFRKLVIESRNLDFVETPEAYNTEAFQAPDEELEPGMGFDEAFSDDINISYDEADLTNALQSNKDSKSLEQTLAKLKTRSKASLQEQGINILYLALYFLEWSDTPAKALNNNQQDNKYKSPLILIPVNLERRGVSGAFKLNLIEDEIRINPTLAYKLDRDYGIDLSQIESQFDELENLEELEELIKTLDERITRDHPDWHLLDESCLSLFSFAKLSLYKDIEDNEERIIKHPVIKQISGEIVEDEEIEKFNPINKQFLINADQIDSKINGNESKLILDADSSQEEAIYAAKAGQSFVIQGPPGTGKSQTIANIIAESLAQNKKILFVSEKKAALDVVINRLKESKLDKFCLELHNSQQKKSEIINNIRTSLDEIKNLAVDSRREEYIEIINEVKAQIQHGIDALHKIRKPINKSLYEIYGQLAQLNLELKDIELDFTIPSIEKIDLKKLSELDYYFQQLAIKSEILDDYDNFIWRNANIQNLSFELENEIKSNLIEFKNILNKLAGYANPIAEKYFNRKVSNLKEFKWVAEAAKLATSSPFPKKDWFESSKLNDVQHLTLEAKVEHEDYALSKTKLLSRYSDKFLELDHQELLSKFTQKFTNLFRFLSIDYWRTMGQIKKLSLYNEARNLQTIIADLRHAAELDQQTHELSKESGELSLKLGDFYKEFDTDWDETINAIRWVEKILGKFNSNTLPAPLIDVISETNDEDEFAEFNQHAQDLIQAHELVKYHINYYKSIFPHPYLDLDTLSFEELTEHLEDLIANMIKIEDWIEFKQLEKQGADMGMEQFINTLISSPSTGLDAQTIRDIFMRKLYQLWVDKIEIENPEMRKFSGQAQELLIEKFNQADQKIFKRNQHDIAKTLSLNWIEYAASGINKHDIQTLNHEINKKKKFKPIRLLMQEIPELLQTLKPCWMMSPLSVSQLIEVAHKEGDPKFVGFDLVIFDEASQIRTEDALCSIYRGKQLILAGDSNQLPPTNFFNYIDNDDDYENNNFESVLDECTVFLDSRTLNWHYRSRHEDLIKFSNYHIYDNQLITFPSPITNSEDLGIEFELIKDGYYEKGSRFNRREAARVAEAILDHYQHKPELSLGVIAFSEAQQFAIERELGKLLRKDPDMDQSFLDDDKSDALFIKNLENVQGDERDTIFFSIGYAYDKKGVLSHNFGPLNREGGHRRLNVAVTRAKCKLKVFTSIVSSDIDLNRTSSQGAMLLKKYLAYTEAASYSKSNDNSIEALEDLAISDNDETHDILQDIDSLAPILSNQTDNDFLQELKQKSMIEESIAKSLEAEGYQVERFLGASEYRIDIAVRSKRKPDQFVLAIETDGEIYRRAKTCRDRERLRRQVLKSLGWKTHRTWARDWVRNPEAELEKILESIH